MLAKIVRVIRRIRLVADDRAVATKVDDDAKQLPLAIPRREYADRRIDRPRRPHNVGMHLPRMRDLAAIAHEKPTIEMNPAHRAAADADFRDAQIFVRDSYRLRDL